MGNGQFLRLQAGRLARALAGRSQLHRAALPRPQSLGRLRPVPQGGRPDRTVGLPSTRTGGSLRLGFPLTEKMWMQTSYTAVARRDLRRRRRTPRSPFKEAEGTSYTSLVGTTLTYDLRNHAKNPTKRLCGSSWRATSPVSAATCSTSASRPRRAATTRSPTRSPSSPASSAARSRAGAAQDVRLIDLFFKGGETVRGFDRAGYGPRDLKTGDALGGYVLLGDHRGSPLPHPVRAGRSRHLAAPCSPMPARCWSASAAASTRACNGLEQRSVCLADSSKIRSSVGASLMWNSPVGPHPYGFREGPVAGIVRRRAVLPLRCGDEVLIARSPLSG